MAQKTPAQWALKLAVAQERCKVAGCTSPVLVTRNPNRYTKVRECADHIGKSVKVDNPAIVKVLTLDVMRDYMEGKVT